MDNLTHSLVGLTLSKAGLERLSPGTSTVCILAANAPDIDLVFGVFGDRWTLLRYHREITHSVIGTLLLALLIPSLFWLGDLLISGWQRRARSIRLRGLLLASVVVSVTHPLMDWTNNYGIRPLLPWSGRWFYGDLVFIVDPFIWVVLGGAAFLLTSRSKLQIILWSLLGASLTLLSGFAGVYRGAIDHPAVLLVSWIAALTLLLLVRRSGYQESGGRAVALASVCLLVVYWVGLGLVHGRALDSASSVAADLTAKNGETVTKLAAMPTLANPTHWQCVVESDHSFYRFELYLLDRTGSVHKVSRFAKPDSIEAQVVSLAERDRRAQILLGFARFPLARVVDHDCLKATLVQFADLRYTEPGKPRGNFSLELPVACPNKP